MLRRFFVAFLLCFSLSAVAQQVTDKDIQQAESVAPPAPPQAGQYNNDDDYFIAQAKLASYSIDSIEIGIRCHKAPPELMDHIFTLHIKTLSWALTQSYGNDKNDISLKGYSEYGQVIKLLDNKIEMLRATRKTNLPSPEQCSAVSESDYSKLVDAMHKQ